MDRFWGQVTLNRYTYVANNPLVFSDPSGMASVNAAMAAVHGGDMEALFGGDNHTAEGEARYEANLAPLLRKPSKKLTRSTRC